MNFNQAIVIGRFGANPEVKFMPNGNAVTNFSLAVTETWKDKEGQKQERTEWIRCVFYSKAAEVIGKYCQKGAMIMVTGRLQTRSYEKDGQTLYITEIVGEKFNLGPKPKDATEASAGRRTAPDGTWSDSGAGVPY